MKKQEINQSAKIDKTNFVIGYTKYCDHLGLGSSSLARVNKHRVGCATVVEYMAGGGDRTMSQKHGTMSRSEHNRQSIR